VTRRARRGLGRRSLLFVPLDLVHKGLLLVVIE
jgi:hypothetical protein